ncbi:hypothetical protein PAXRUDRAFT_147497 [Paxillus rubicundulus Ve08.2h10]|uniref:Uncharacterized protein n=1 Tax=Paxillus rubicundulus Ve08.2h10 TaxID=930991 RepID=A0A0D0E4U5_9AGAM|nr:hypothetical protein PAXRUDRAFT_147497 [Paxillus rubicundulus Ve08.2h10]
MIVDSVEEWMDKLEELTTEELEQLEMMTCPIRLALFKVWQLAYKIIHMTTILLPVWQEILKELNLKVTYLLHDVATW